MNGQKRLEWIQAISRYQEFDFFSPRSSICRQHFKVDDIIIKNEKYILKKQGLPSIFPGTSHLDDDSMQPQLIDTNSIHHELLTDGKRFCRIKYCPNEKRTNKDVSFFRAPMVGDLRVQWIDMISGHQQNDTFSTGFMVCELHFLAEHFIVENGRKILKRDTIPSIFDIKPNTSSGNRNHSVVVLDVSSTMNTDSELSHDFTDCDTPVGANDNNKLHDFEFVSLNGSYPIIKNEPLDESTNSDKKRIFVPETVEEHSCATHNVAKRAKTSVLACDSCDDLNTELQKAREKIVLLEKFIQTQNKTIRRQRNTILQLRK
ncbi:uncharacterized protein LOC129568941 isoform X1 [Sitodiplosis mosellana]|uniref:uncharacterized protein LOC129568941 isoform X1 n=1 Tax=Sitodiplosis mosellana TaxID=263140 RepID=UPI0024442B07|nr:uncharacterized protein LOC129568941 isoform X1 [Sitodiplosis mosellana]